MTSAGGRPRTRDELVDQLRAAQTGTAAPWFEDWRRQPSAPVATTPSRKDEHESALLDPVLDPTEQIGFMSILAASSRAVHVDFLREHLGLGETDLVTLVADLERAGYIDERTSHGGRSRCAATYAGSSATRRHRQALRQVLAGSPA